MRPLSTGTCVCIAVMLTDQLVVAKSAFDHSVNDCSVIVFSKSEVIDDYEMKAEFFKLLTEKVVPGSWDYLRPLKKSEVEKTMLIALDVKEASAIILQGMPYSEESEITKLPKMTYI